MPNDVPHDDLVTAIADMIRHIRRDDGLAVDRDTDIAALGIDSLDFVDLVFTIEEKYDVSIAFNANTDGSFPFATVGDAANAVALLIQQRKQAA